MSDLMPYDPCQNAHFAVADSSDNPASFLLTQAIEGDHLAFARLTERHRRMLQQTAFRIIKCHNDTEDVVQESMLRAYRNLHNFRGDAKFSTWLARITINTALMHLRKQKRRRELSIDGIGPEDLSLSSLVGILHPSQHESLQHNDYAESLLVATKQLPDHIREVLELRIFHELSTREVSVRLGITLAAVKARMHRGKKYIQKHLNTLRLRKLSAARSLAR